MVQYRPWIAQALRAVDSDPVYPAASNPALRHPLNDLVEASIPARSAKYSFKIVLLLSAISFIS